MDLQFRRNLWYSGGGHVLVVLLLLAGSALAGRLARPDTITIIEIDLFNPEGNSLGMAGETTPPPAAEVEEPEPEPEPEPVVAPPEAPKPDPAPEPAPKPKPPPTREEQKAAMRKRATEEKTAPRAQAQPRDLSGAVGRLAGPGVRLGPSTGVGNMPGRGGSNQYQALIVARLKALWQRPFQTGTVGAPPEVAFTVEADGRISEFRFLSRSGDAALDQSVAAIFTPELRVPPPPKELGPRLQLEVTFVATD